MNRNPQTGGRIVYMPVPGENRPECNASCRRSPDGCNPGRCLLLLIRRCTGSMYSALQRLYSGLERRSSGWDPNLIIVATAVLLLLMELLLAISKGR